MSLFHNNTLLGASGSGSDPLYVDDVFSCDLYTGTGASHTITNDIDLSGEGGLVWIKRRDGTNSNLLYDTERGVNAYLSTNMDADQYTASSQQLTAFNSNGFTVGTESWINGSSSKFVSWSFRKCPGFFDVVTYTGNGSNRTISHNLGSTPGFMIVKRYSNSEDWTCFHRSMGGTKWVQMNGTNYLDEQTLSTIWNNTAPDASVFTVGTHDRVNTNGETYVAYLFAHDAQDFGDDSDEAIIKCDTTTIGGTGTFDVNNLGFEPQYIIFKQISGGMGTPDWFIHDNRRGLVHRNYNPLLANKLNAENENSYYYNEGIFTVNPQGFKSTLSAHNAGTYIYIAIRRPHKPPTAGTDVFKAVTYSGNSSAQTVSGAGFAPDWMWSKDRSASNNGWYHDRLRGVYSIDSSGSGGDQDRISYVAQPPFTMDGVEFIAGGFDLNRNGSNHVAHFMKRAPGFFDMVYYTGNGSSGNVKNHNLGVVPELMIVKKISEGSNADWQVYHSGLGNTKAIRLDGSSTGNAAAVTSSAYWNDTSPTATQFTLGSSSNVNANNETHIAYLFATLDGISKVGTYTGTGSGGLNVDCGFSSAARYVLFKRSNNTGHWYVWDHARGIVSGNEPFLELNKTSGETGGSDFIDPLSTGFTLTSETVGADGMNADGSTYIFFAIA